jgi:glycosyltransferase involved in cell wall biosynthesis
MKPALTVLLPVHNSAQYLGEALDSIRAQTFCAWDMLIIDDHSSDGSREIGEEFARRDTRIKVIGNTRTQGVAGALNTGLEVARGAFIARMDADDLCLPTRFAEQLAFLEKHPALCMCGTAVQTFGVEKRTRSYPADAEQLRAFTLFNSPFAHPTVLWRRAWFEREQLRYDETAYPEDYELWARVVTHFPAANLDRVLLRYRVHATSSTGAGWQRMDAQAARISGALLARLGLTASADEWQLHRRIAQGRSACTREFLARAAAWLARVAMANVTNRWSTPEAFRAVACDLWFALCMHSTPLGGAIVRAYAAAPFAARGRTRAAHLALLALTVVKNKIRPAPAQPGAASCAC